MTDRAVPGHWEGDLVFSKHLSSIATLVERSTRYMQMIALPEGHRAELVADALAESVQTLRRQQVKTLTWDQGTEMADHPRFTVATGIQVYFCDPKSPWQRGSKTPTGCCANTYPAPGPAHDPQDDLDTIAAKLNGRPRQALGFQTPSEALAKVLR